MPVPERTKWLGVLSADPDTKTIEYEPGCWWYNSTEKRWKFWDGSEVRVFPVRVKKAATGDLTIPIGGGSVTASVTIADLGLASKIELLIGTNILRKVPIVDDVYAPSAGINTTLDAIGITVAAGTGTTLVAEVVAVGY